MRAPTIVFTILVIVITRVPTDVDEGAFIMTLRSEMVNGGLAVLTILGTSFAMVLTLRAEGETDGIVDTIFTRANGGQEVDLEPLRVHGDVVSLTSSTLLKGVAGEATQLLLEREDEPNGVTILGPVEILL